jgi:hypothetical protein
MAARDRAGLAQLDGADIGNGEPLVATTMPGGEDVDSIAWCQPDAQRLGERLGARAKPMLDYLKVFERSANLFPGFEVEVQGIYREVEPDGSIRFYTYVMRE